MPRKNVSVILTAFNGSKYIEKQLESILNQTLQPDEIIICDDKSTDQTVSLLSRYLASDKVKLFVNDKQLGVVENFKKAAKLAKHGNWLVFSDQDDIWIPQKLERLSSEMQLIDDDITPALVYSDLSIIDKNDKIIAASFWEKQKIKPEKINLARLLYGNVVTGCTMIINYPMAEEFFCINGSNYLHDEWVGLIAYSFGKVKFLRERLVLYRQHESNVTYSEDYKVSGFIDKIKADFNYFLNNEKFLFREFDLAKEFLLKYRDRLDQKNIETIEKFIKLKDKNYIIKRITRKFTY
jgi:glycosyltransferase involved in cell wall biosynthesis